jgi:hypothetical protein
MRITFPVAAGDTGIIVCSDRSMDTWLGLASPQDTAPMDARRHSLQDGVYIPGVNVSGQSWATADPGVITIGDDTQPGAFVGRVGDAVQVTLTTSEVGQILAPSGGGACTAVGPITLSGQITGGSATVKVLG